MTDAHPLQRRLDLVIQLLLEIVPDEGKTMTAKMDRLLDLGCTQSETAHILRKEPKDVTSYVSKRRRRNAGKPKADVGAQS